MCAFAHIDVCGGQVDVDLDVFLVSPLYTSRLGTSQNSELTDWLDWSTLGSYNTQLLWVLRIRTQALTAHLSPLEPLPILLAVVPEAIWGRDCSDYRLQADWLSQPGGNATRTTLSMEEGHGHITCSSLRRPGGRRGSGSRSGCNLQRSILEACSHKPGPICRRDYNLSKYYQLETSCSGTPAWKGLARAGICSGLGATPSLPLLVSGLQVKHGC